MAEQKWPIILHYGHLELQDNTLMLKDHFTVGCSVTWPLNDSEAGADLVLIERPHCFWCVHQFVV